MSKTIRPPSGLLPIDLGEFELSKSGLTVSGNPTFKAWEKCGLLLTQMEGAIQFWIGDWLNYGERAYGEKYAQAIDASQAAVWRQYAYVARAVEMSTRVDNLPWTHHREVAGLAEGLSLSADTVATKRDLQRRLLQVAANGKKRDNGEFTALTKSEFKELIRQVKHKAKIDAIEVGSVPSGVYDVIAADPPWAYDNAGFEQSSAGHYPTMDVDTICRLPQTSETFPKFADPAVLFLWATSPLLPSALTVMAAWGFEYRGSLVWIKDKAPGLGWWLKTRHELLLVGVRGSCTPIEKVDSVIDSAAQKHSEKPAEAYARIVTMFPGLRNVECFARAPRPGWDVWGDESPGVQV